MQQIMGDVEQIVRGHPDQWYMFRRMAPAPPPALGAPRSRAALPDGTPAASRWTPDEAGRLLRRRLRELRPARTRLFGAGVRLAEALPAPLLSTASPGAPPCPQSAPHPGPAGAPAQPGAVLVPPTPLCLALSCGGLPHPVRQSTPTLRGGRLSGAEASARTVAEGEGWAPFRQAIARRGACWSPPTWGASS